MTGVLRFWSRIRQLMGQVLEGTDDYSFGSFRLAWTMRYPIWVGGVVAVLVFHRKMKRYSVIESGRNAVVAVAAAVR